MDKSNEPPITGVHHLTINTTPSQETLSLESIHTLRITERIQIEGEIADILLEETIASYIRKYKR